jgi:solute carrier family 13 (sodium-dependent dicarboxylate transporter), member 2/3/5
MPAEMQPPAPRVVVESAAPGGPPPEERRNIGERVGLWLGPVVFLLLLLLPPPEGMPLAAWRTAAGAALMAIWWVSEAVPISATALLPLVVFPLLGVLPIGEAAAAYGNPIIFLFMGGLILALAMERWELHRRIALAVVRAVGVEPHRLVLGVMVATACISMWVSNTATAVMMLPIALSVANLARSEGAGPAEAADPHFALNLMLGVAYASSIGGFGTLIGTPPNALLAGFMLESYGVEIGFGQWMLLGVPLVVVTLPLSWLLLTRVFYPIRLREIPGGREEIERAYRALGPISPAERRVAALFALTALLWIFRPAIGDAVPGLDDAGIAVAAALLLFLVPAGGGKGPLMDWKTAERLPWGVLILFGGGLSLAAAVSATDLADWIGAAMSGLGWAPFAMVLAVTVVIVFLTELTSNTATAATFLPLTASIAVGLGENPLLLAIPAALAASAGFMMPAGTPPNAIVYGSGYVTIGQMARAGVWINLLFIVAIVALMYTVGPWAFGIEPGVLPAWAVPE